AACYTRWPDRKNRAYQKKGARYGFAWVGLASTDRASFAWRGAHRKRLLTAVCPRQLMDQVWGRPLHADGHDSSVSASLHTATDVSQQVVGLQPHVTRG